MTAPAPNHDALDAQARPHLDAIVHMIVEPDGRVAGDVRQYWWRTSRARLARPPVVDEAGAWQATDADDGEQGSGRGLTSLVCWLTRTNEVTVGALPAELLGRARALA
jgi:hypothetical protein